MMNYQDDYIYPPNDVYRSKLPKADLTLIEGMDFYDSWEDSEKEVKLTFTEFPNLITTYGVEHQLSWKDFVRYIIGQGHRAQPTKNAPLIGGYWLIEGLKRSNANVGHVALFICDIDSKPDMPLPPSFEEMKARFHSQANGIYACKVLGYTTFSHSRACPRYRLIFPLARSLAPSEYPALWAGFNEALGGILDSATKDIARIHYLPCCPANMLSEAQCFSAHQNARFPMVNPEPLIIRGRALILPQRLTKIFHSSKPETPKNIADVRSMLSSVSADCDYVIYRDIVWSILSTGWSCSIQLAEDWCKTAPHRYDENNFNIVVDSYKPDLTNPITLGTLIHHARKGAKHG